MRKLGAFLRPVFFKRMPTAMDSREFGSPEAEPRRLRPTCSGGATARGKNRAADDTPRRSRCPAFAPKNPLPRTRLRGSVLLLALLALVLRLPGLGAALAR